MQLADDATLQKVDQSLVKPGETDESSGVLIPDCDLPSVSYDESPLDWALLFVFRKLVTMGTGYSSPKEVTNPAPHASLGFFSHLALRRGSWGCWRRGGSTC